MSILEPSDRFSKYHIIYTKGGLKVLTVVEICQGCEHEIDDYKVASRQSFDTQREAYEYAKELAEKHGLTVDTSDLGQEALYLD